MTVMRDLGRPDWGRVRIGSVELPLRGVVSVTGIALWLAIAVVLAGFDHTLAAVAANAGFVAGLVLLASLTRTIGVITVARVFVLGALAMAIMLLIAGPLAGLARDPSTTVDPIAEELLKLIPLVLLLWQGRRLSIWQLGATDILLIAVAAGAGFAVVEDAYIRMNEGWGDTLPFLPTTEIYEDRIRGSRIIPGHAIWTGLAGVTIGVAWLVAHIRPVLVVAPLGFAIALADHIASNSGHALPELAVLVIILFVTGVVGVVALDLFVLRRKLPAVPELDAAISRPGPLTARWRRLLASRRLRFAAWRFAPRSARSGAAQRAVEASVIELVDNRSS
ncbi:MAG: PrsW family glutamic-type intramembrane protease [Chloroflexota bacterium]